MRTAWVTSFSRIPLQMQIYIAGRVSFLRRILARRGLTGWSRAAPFPSGLRDEVSANENDSQLQKTPHFPRARGADVLLPSPSQHFPLPALSIPGRRDHDPTPGPGNPLSRAPPPTPCCPQSSMASTRPRLLFLVTEDWYFLSHRLPMARAAVAAGYDVFVATGDTGRLGEIEAAGFTVAPVRLDRRSINPWGEIRAIADVVRVYRQVRPHVVHHVALKPVVDGTIAARIAGVPKIINALTGLGYVFTSPAPMARALSAVIRPLLRLLVAGQDAQLVLQNRDDAALLARLGVANPETTVLVPGSGVDLGKFRSRRGNRPDGPIIVMMAGRALVDKGLREFVEAARILKAARDRIKFVFVGAPDPDNRASVSARDLEEWTNEGALSWAGPRQDMADAWREADIAVLPSYREGLPKTLLEAAATELPLIATNVPGCRDICLENETGLLIPPHDPYALAEAILRLANDEVLRHRLGRNARKLVEEKFSADLVAEMTRTLYESVKPIDGVAQP